MRRDWSGGAEEILIHITSKSKISVHKLWKSQNTSFYHKTWHLLIIYMQISTIKQVFFHYQEGGLVDHLVYKPYTLVGHPALRLVLDPLAVIFFNNHLYANSSPFSGDFLRDFRMSKLLDKSYSTQVLSKTSMWEHILGCSILTLTQTKVCVNALFSCFRTYS